MNRRDVRIQTPPWPIPDPAVAEVLRQMALDGTWGQYDGPHAERLTTALAQYHQSDAAYLCASGTFAVELALRSLGVQAGDEVVLAAYDFPGNFRAIESIGATAVLVDIEPVTCSLDAQYLNDACESGNVRAILVSHLHGGLANMSEICQFAQQANIAVVEDACQAVGANVQGRRAGTWGDVGTLSFGGSKLLTAGRGGALVTSRADVLQRAKIFCERGNHAFPLSEMQAAVILPQLNQLDERNALRRARAEMLRNELQDEGVLIPITTSGRGDASHYKLGWLIRTDGAPAVRDALLQSAWKIGADLGPGFRGFARRSERRCRHVGPLTHSRAAAEQIVLLHHPLLLAEATDDLHRLAVTLKSAVQTG